MDLTCARRRGSPRGGRCPCRGGTAPARPRPAASGGSARCPRLGTPSALRRRKKVLPPNTNMLKEWLLLTVVGEGVPGEPAERGRRGCERAEMAAGPVVRVVLPLQTDGERQEL